MLQLNSKLPEPQIFSIFNLPVHLLDNYIDWLEERLRQRIGTHVVTINAEMTMLANENSNLASIIRQANLVVPEGSGVYYLVVTLQQKLIYYSGKRLRAGRTFG